MIILTFIFEFTSVVIGEFMELEKVLKLLQSKEHLMREKGANELYKILYQPLMGFYRTKKT